MGNFFINFINGSRGHIRDITMVNKAYAGM